MEPVPAFTVRDRGVVAASLLIVFEKETNPALEERLISFLKVTAQRSSELRRITGQNDFVKLRP